MMIGRGRGSRVVEALDRCLTPVENLAAVIAGAFTLAAMVLTTLDALMRYGLNRPLEFQFYFTSNYLLVGLVLMALPWDSAPADTSASAC